MMLTILSSLDRFTPVNRRNFSSSKVQLPDLQTALMAKNELLVNLGDLEEYHNIYRQIERLKQKYAPVIKPLKQNIKETS